MPSLSDSLARLGATELSSHLGEGTVELLQALDLRNLSPSSLAKIFVDQVGPEGILFDKRNRNNLLDALSKSDAERLERLLGLPESDNPWSVIKSPSYTPRSPQCDILLNFFGCPLIETSDETSVYPTPYSINPDYSLFPHQVQATRQVWELMKDSDRPRAFLHMPTGAGKTRTSMNIIAEFLRQKAGPDDVVVWLAHSEELCDQAAEEFQNAWQQLGNRAVNIHRLYGRYSEKISSLDSGFVVAGLQLLYSRSLREQSEFLKIARRVALVIMDEAHQAVAPTYQHILELLASHPRTIILGLSATPGRSYLDAGQDVKLAEFFKRRKVTLRVEGYESPVLYLQEEGYLAKVEYNRIPGIKITLTKAEEEKLNLELDLPLSVLSKLGNDAKRNLLIITKLIEEAKLGGQIIVFACSVDHAHLLANILSAKGIQAAAITSRTPEARRRQLISQYREASGLQIICNYGVLTTGFDAPRTNCAFIVRPTQSVVLFSQMVGRASRGPKAGGNDTCRIVTVVDKIPGFRSVAEGFEFFEEVWE